MLVFRDGRRTVSGEVLLQGLAQAVRSLETDGPSSLDTPSEDKVINAMLRAGELECALADAALPEAVRMAELTNALAYQLVTKRSSYRYSDLLELVSGVSIPLSLQISPPEGFAYYALHPLRFADATHDMPLRSGYVAVIGVRSIGTTLSAVVVAALRRRGIVAERITLRPSGHPFDRRTEFSENASRWIARQLQQSAEFLVVDEGPGLSGSSLLSVADALAAAGADPSTIAFLCSSEPDVARLCARAAAARWVKFRTYCAAPRTMPGDAHTDIGGGQWREVFYADESHWPASWTQMERAKSLSRDKQLLFKFEGLGRFGREVYERSCVLGQSGFASAPRDFDSGYVSYPVLRARPASAGDISETVLDQLAEYCAFRRREFQLKNDPLLGFGPNLSEMLQWNIQEEFGCELARNDAFQIPNRAQGHEPILVDGRMQPHEWMVTPNGLLKVDGASHGDDHFFPGPTDIAWDLAGAIVEWHMSSLAKDYFTHRYRFFSGDDPQERLPSFIQAYTAFRLGYCRMAADSMRGTGEEERLYREYQRYRTLLAVWLPKQVVAS